MHTMKCQPKRIPGEGFMESSERRQDLSLLADNVSSLDRHSMQMEGVKRKGRRKQKYRLSPGGAEEVILLKWRNSKE